MQTTFSVSLETLHQVAEQIAASTSQHKIFTFSGQMGSGKTTLIREICRQLRVIETVTSPTFAIINEYSTPKGLKIAHLDCYRIETVKEIIDIGIEEYFDSNTIVFIEWPEKIEDILKYEVDVVQIEITVKTENTRQILMVTP